MFDWFEFEWNAQCTISHIDSFLQIPRWFVFFDIGLMFSLAKLRICWIFLGFGCCSFFQGLAFVGSLAPGVYNGAPARFVLGTETLRIWRRFGITRRRFGSKAVKTVVTTYLQLAAAELKKNGKFKLGGSLNMKLKKKPATKKLARG